MFRHSSDPMGDLIFFIGFFIVIGGICYIQHLLDKKRRQKIESYALRNGMEYFDSPGALINCEIPFRVNDMTKGHSHGYSALVYGKKAEIDFQMVEYSYVVGSGKSSHHYHYTMCLLTKEGVCFPQFFMRKENTILDFIGEKFGGQDIDFAEDNTFSDSFVLQGPDEQAIRSFFNSKVRSAFVKYKDYGYIFESNGTHLLVYVEGALANEKRLELFSRALSLFSSIIPKNTDGYLN